MVIFADSGHPYHFVYLSHFPSAWTSIRLMKLTHTLPLSSATHSLFIFSPFLSNSLASKSKQYLSKNKPIGEIHICTTNWIKLWPSFMISLNAPSNMRSPMSREKEPLGSKCTCYDGKLGTKYLLYMGQFQPIFSHNRFILAHEIPPLKNLIGHAWASSGPHPLYWAPSLPHEGSGTKDGTHRVALWHPNPSWRYPTKQQKNHLGCNHILWSFHLVFYYVFDLLGYSS